MNLTKGSAALGAASRLCLAPEVLEDRVVLSAGQGRTFAIMPGAVTTAGQVSTVNFKLDPSMFTTPKRNGDIVIGLDVAAATSTSSSTTSALQPQIVSVTDASGHTIRAQHTKYDAKVAKANKLGNACDFSHSGDVEASGQRDSLAPPITRCRSRGLDFDHGHVPGGLLSAG